MIRKNVKNDHVSDIYRGTRLGIEIDVRVRPSLAKSRHVSEHYCATLNKC